MTSDDIRWHPGHQYSDAKITQQGRGPGEECTNWLRIPGHCDKTSQSLPRFYIIWAGNQIPEISQTRAHLWEHLGHFWTARGDKILRECDFFPQPKNTFQDTTIRFCLLGRTWIWTVPIVKFFLVLDLVRRILSSKPASSTEQQKERDCWVVGVNDRDRGDEIASLEH